MAGETTIMKLGKTKTLREIENKIEIMKSGKTRTLYENMWKDSTFDFGMILPTNDDSSSYRFSDGEIFERCFEEVRKEHEKLIDIAKRKKAAPKEEKGNYNKEYEEQKDTYDKKKAAYDEAIKELLVKQFGLHAFFKDKYDMAVSGSGSESFKITTLHSSSLCCLLFFYNVTENNPLILPLTTNTGNRTVKFSKSVFEFKNEVISGRSPSNVDVVLVGKIKKGEEGGGKDVVLFLESKFAEYYLSSGGTCNIGEGYLTNEKSVDLYKKMGLEINKTKNRIGEDVYKLHSEQIFYINGIKQMISHYIGIKNLMEGNIFDKYESNDERKNVQNLILFKNPIVILGEIVFELPNDDAKKALNKYREKYKILAEIIAEKEADNSQFEILDRLWDYSELFTYEDEKYEVEPKIIDFYKKGL